MNSITLDSLLQEYNKTKSFKHIENITDKAVIESFLKKDKNKLVKIYNSFIRFRKRIIPNSLITKIFKLLENEEHELILRLIYKLENDSEKVLLFMILILYSIEVLKNDLINEIYLNALEKEIPDNFCLKIENFGYSFTLILYLLYKKDSDLTKIFQKKSLKVDFTTIRFIKFKDAVKFYSNLYNFCYFEYDNLKEEFYNLLNELGNGKIEDKLQTPQKNEIDLKDEIVTLKNNIFPDFGYIKNSNNDYKLIVKYFTNGTKDFLNEFIKTYNFKFFTERLIKKENFNKVERYNYNTEDTEYLKCIETIKKLGVKEELNNLLQKAFENCIKTIENTKDIPTIGFHINRFWAIYIRKFLKFFSEIKQFDYCFEIVKKIKEKNFKINPGIIGVSIYRDFICNLIKNSMYDKAIEAYNLVATTSKELKYEILSIMIKEIAEDLIKKNTYKEEILKKLEDEQNKINDIDCGVFLVCDTYINLGKIYLFFEKFNKFQKIYELIEDKETKLSFMVEILKSSIEFRKCEFYLTENNFKDMLQYFIFTIKNKYPHLFREVIEKYIEYY